MRRLLGILLAVLIGCPGSVPGEAVAHVPASAAIAYTYDGVHNTTAVERVYSERGPPSGSDYTYDGVAVDTLSNGASTRPDGATSWSATTYSPSATAAQVASATTKTAGNVVVDDWDGSSPARWQVAANNADEFVELASAARRTHILDGEVRPNGTFGGGHRAGTGFPKKSEFPASWSDDEIMHNISDVATDPSLVWRAGDNPGDFWVNGTRGGVDIEVLIRSDEIWTAYPTNLGRNP